MEHIDLEKFLSLPANELANIVRADRTKTCVFPFNGTRRWFLLEHGREFNEETAKNYVDLTARGYVATYKLVFDHGLDNIVAPVFGGEIFNRGEEYMREIGSNMTLFATHPAFLELYENYGVRVHFYGDYRRQLNNTPYSYICDAFDEVTRKTAHHKGRALFYGVCADDATVTVADLAIRYYQDTGKSPSRRELIEQYYGEYIEKADIFIGFEKFNVFDYPMLGWGEEVFITPSPLLYIWMIVNCEISCMIMFTCDPCKTQITSPCQKKTLKRCENITGPIARSLLALERLEAGFGMQPTFKGRNNEPTSRTTSE